MLMNLTAPSSRRDIMSLWLAFLVVLLTGGSILGSSSLIAQDASSSREQAERLRQAGLSDAARGSIDNAIASFEKGLALEPNDPALLEAVGAAYSLKGQLETARKYLVQSLSANPDSVSTRQNLGIVLFSLGRLDDAARQFTTIRDVRGKPHAIASLFLGMIAQQHSDCGKAIPLIEDSGNLLEQYPDALLSYSECQFETGNFIKTGDALASFYRLPEKTALQSHQAQVLYARLKAAKDDRNSGDSQAHPSPNSVLRRAKALEDADRLEEAQGFLEAEAAVRPTFDVLLELAEVAKRRDDYAIAMKSLKHASELEPGREESYLEFSTICADHGNDQLALDSAEIGLEHVPDSYRLTVQKGAVQEKLGHLGDAEQTLKRAIGMQKDNSIALASLAVVQAHGGRLNEAERTLADAIKQFPDDYYMYYFRAKLLLQSGDNQPDGTDRRERARNSLEKAIQLNPEYADAYYQLSGIYADTSVKDAEQALQKCLQLDPTHIPAEYALARLYVRTGRKAEAAALFARLKGQQRTEELEQQKQLRIEVAHN